MILIKHPTLRTTRFVPEADLDRWLRAGWLKGLSDEQESRLDEIQAEVDTETPEVPAAATAAEYQGQHSDEGEET